MRHERVVSCVVPLTAVAAARLVCALIGGAAAAGCETATAPASAALLARPAVFAEWWQDVERCSSTSGELDRVEWYVVPCQDGEAGFRCAATPDGLCAGEWLTPHTIQLAGPNRFFADGYVDDEWTVKHEMLHDLLGTAEHPDAFRICRLALR